MLMSSSDWGTTWKLEAAIAPNNDVREPFFMTLNGKLFFQYFGGGKSSVQFTPQEAWQVERKPNGTWSELLEVGQKHEVPWDYKLVDGTVFQTSYVGNHYGFIPTQSASPTYHDVHVFLKYSRDAERWRYVTPADKSVD